jgi:hypothetical protein
MGNPALRPSQVIMSVRHTGRRNVAEVASTKTSVEDEMRICAVSTSGITRARWQGVFRRSAPAHLTRHLLFAVIAYRLQADRQSIIAIVAVMAASRIG